MQPKLYSALSFCCWFLHASDARIPHSFSACMTEANVEVPVGTPGVGVKQTYTKTGSDTGAPVDSFVSPTETSPGKFSRRKIVVSKPPRKETTPRLKRSRPSSPPTHELRRSGRVTRRSTAPPTSISSPVVIEDEDEEEEASEVEHDIPEESGTDQWVSSFVRALLLCFRSELSGDALIAAVTEAGKIPLNAARMARNQLLTERFTEILSAVRELLATRERIKAMDLMADVPSLIEEYRAKSVSEQASLPGQLHQINLQIDQESAALSRTDVRSSQLGDKCEKVSSLVTAAEADVTRVEMELARARQVLEEYRHRQEGIKAKIAELEKTREAAKENRARLIALAATLQARISAPPLSEGDMERVAREVAQKSVASEIDTINRQLNDLLSEALKL